MILSPVLTEAVSFPLVIIFLYLIVPLSDPLLLLSVACRMPPHSQGLKKRIKPQDSLGPVDLTV